MLRNLKYKVDSNESIRKLRRYIDGHISYRKLFFILLLVTVILLYFGPKLIGYFTRGEQTFKGKCCVYLYFHIDLMNLFAKYFIYSFKVLFILKF